MADIIRITIEHDSLRYNDLGISFIDWFQHYGMTPVKAYWLRTAAGSYMLDIDPFNDRNTVIWDTMDPCDGPSYFYFVDADIAMLFKLTFGGA